MNYEKIGEFIALKRKEKNLTQRDLAKKIGVTDKAVSRWETGLGCPDVSILEILSKELDVSVLELLKGRKIENEVINITEADDYIKQSAKVTLKNQIDKVKRVISIVSVTLIIIICTLVCFYNFKNYVRINKKYKIEEYFYNRFKGDHDKNIASLEESIRELETVKDKIELADYNKLVSASTNMLDIYKNLDIYKYKTGDKVTYNDAFLDMMSIGNVFSSDFNSIVNLSGKYIKSPLYGISKHARQTYLSSGNHLSQNYYAIFNDKSLSYYKDNDSLLIDLMGIHLKYDHTIEYVTALITEIISEVK